MLPSKVGVTGYLLIVAVLGGVAAYLIHDPSGARLELAPVFLAAALAASAVRLMRRPGSRRDDRR